MAFSSPLVDSNRDSFTIEGEAQCMKTDVQVDNGGLTAFKIFVEGIMAASLTCNMDTSPAVALKERNLRRSNRLSKNKDVPCEKGTPMQEEAKFMKVSVLPCLQTLPKVLFFPCTRCLPQIEKFGCQMSFSSSDSSG